MFSILAGWLEGVRQVPTCRCGPRPAPLDISLIVVHGITLPPGEFHGAAPYIDGLFTHTLDKSAHPYFAAVGELEVSTHVLIDRQGKITQYVSFLDRAWHAGRSAYLGRMECNDYGIGIELEGTDDIPYAAAQYHTLRELILSINQEYPRTRGHLAGHSEVAPGRKTDPGPAFDWQALDLPRRLSQVSAL